VRHAVQDLPEHYRLPVWLHYCEGLSSPEVACPRTPSAASSPAASRSSAPRSRPPAWR
jgi:hypothetical protein